MAGRERAHRRSRRAGSRQASLLPLFGLAAAAAGIYLAERAEWRRGEETARAEAAAAAARRALLATGELDAAYAGCEAEWQAMGAWVWPQALSFTRERLTVYVPLGVDGGSWRSLLCDADGVRAGPRTVRPWRELLPAEAPIGGAAEEAATTSVVQRLAGFSLAGGELAIEAASHPVTGELVVRRWRGLEGGARPEVEPAGAPELPSLLPAAPFTLAPGVTAPPPLRELRRYRWAEDAAAAFALLERALPPGATVAELTLDDERIAVTVDAPTPGIDGEPPAPYGDLEWDAYGIADRAWWYPRTSPGFGCPRGRPLAELRATFTTAAARHGSAGIARAWYSCSPAFSDGEVGVWNLRERAP